MIKIGVIIENKTENPDCFAEFGLSLYVENRGHKILFDTGATNQFIHNAKTMGINLAEVDKVVISHGHYDHTGGIPEFVKINNKAPVYIHKEAFKKCYGFTDGIIDDEPCSIEWDKDDYTKRLVLTEETVKLYDNVWIVGNIPAVTGYVPAEKFYEKEGGDLIEDQMNHEQFMAIEEDEGIYLFSGCSHKGIISAIECAKGMFPEKPIAGLIAGMHLYPATPEQREDICEKVAHENIGFVMPLHCTGIEAICILKKLMGDKCITGASGDIYEY